MRRAFAAGLWTVAALGMAGCRHDERMSRSETRGQIIEYPAGVAGEALRMLYSGTMDEAQKASQTLSDEKTVTEKDRKALEPAMLAIIRCDHSERALFVGSRLSEWNPKLTREAPEFRKLVPTLARHLDDPNDDEDTLKKWNALGSAFLLARIGPEAAYPEHEAIGRRFCAPVARPIQGESYECWTRYVLEYLLVCFGKEGVPPLVRGLEHKDPWVRTCAVAGLGRGISEMTEDMVGPVTQNRLAEFQRVAKGTGAMVAQRLWDDNESVRTMAVRVLPHLLPREAVTPRVHARLLEILQGEDNYDAARTVAAYHPLFTPDLLGMLKEGRHGAGQALAAIGRPVAGQVIELLGEAPEASKEVLKEMGPAAIPDLAKAAKGARSPQLQQQAKICLDENVKSAREDVDRIAPALDDPQVSTRLARIKIMCDNAPVAGSAVPYLEKLAKSDPDPEVRSAAKVAIEKIEAEKVDLP